MLGASDEVFGAQGREDELLGLLETTRDLTRMSTDSRILPTIVERARSMVRADAAFLNLADDRYLRLFESDAARSALKIASGGRDSWVGTGRARFASGIARVVMDTRLPYASSDYLSDERLVHDEATDEIAAREKIRGIVGTPLCVGEHVVGILFLADRRVRDWSEREVKFIASMANHAAVALENAYLFTELEDTVELLTAANAAVQAHSDAQQRAVAVHEELMALALGGSDFGTFAASIGRLLDAGVMIVDDALTTKGTSGSSAQVEFLNTAKHDGTVADAMRNGLNAKAVDVEPPDDFCTSAVEVVVVTPVQAGDRTLGALLLAPQSPMDAERLRSLEAASHVLGLLLMLEDSLAVAEMQVRGELIDDIFGERRPDPTLLVRRGQQIRFDPDAPHVVVVATLDQHKRHAARSSASVFASRRRGIAGERSGHLVFVLPGEDPLEMAELVRRQQLRATVRDVTSAGAGPATGVDALRACYRDAVHCHEMMLTTGRTGEAAVVDDFGVLGLVLGESDGQRLRQLAKGTLGPLLAYDDEHSSELVATLETYFAAGQVPSVAAGTLHVHQNTVYQRLARVDQILGTKTWREPDGALEMQLALRALRVLKTL